MTSWGKRKDGQAYPKSGSRGIKSSSTKPVADVHMKENNSEKEKNKIKELDRREPWALNSDIAKQLGIPIERVRRVRGLDLLDSEKFGVDWHEEMGHNNMSIHVYTEDQNHTVWALHEPEEIQELIEDGFFNWEDKRSILNWLYHSGVIDDYFIKTRKSLNQIHKHR